MPNPEKEKIPKRGKIEARFLEDASIVKFFKTMKELKEYNENNPENRVRPIGTVEREEEEN